MIMPIDAIFYVVFLSQVILLSYYYPTKLNQRFNTVWATYPPEDYPKLYPVPIEKTKRWQTIYIRINQFILICGLVLLALFSTDLLETKPSQKIALLFGIIQFLPLMITEISGYKQLKLMRKKNNRSTRKAELNPRQLSNYISMKIVYFSVLMIITCILFVLYKNQFRWNEEVIIMIFSLTLSNGLYVGIIFFHLYGKKLDPHQISEDRAKVTSFISKSLVLQSIVISVFLTSLLAMEMFKLEQFESTIYSLYWQIIASFGIGSMLKTIKVEDLDFSVYKANNSGVKVDV